MYKEKGISLRLKREYYEKPGFIYVGTCKRCKECMIGKYKEEGWLGCKEVSLNCEMNML